MFGSLRSRYQNNLAIIYCIISVIKKLKFDRWYKNSPDWIKSKKQTINPINKYGYNCFQCPVTLSLGNEHTGKNSGKISKIRPFINKYN